MTKIAGIRCEEQPGKTQAGLYLLLNFIDVITAGHTILNVENELRPRRKPSKPCWNG